MKIEDRDQLHDILQEEREKFEAWMKGRTDDASVMIAARAALRVIPLLAYELEGKIRFAPQWWIMPAFFSTASALAYSFSPEDGASENWAASMVHFEPYDDDLPYTVSAEDAAYAARGCAVAYESVSSTSDYASSGIKYAATAANDVGASDQLLESVRLDIAMLEAGATVRSVIGKPLWRDGKEPDWSAKRWKMLSEHLLDPASKSGTDDHSHWSIWTDWWEARRDGKAYDIDVERRIACVDECIEAMNNPAAFNARLKNIVT